MTPWETAMLLTGFIFGSCLGLAVHVRWLRHQARINEQVEQRFIAGLDSTRNLHTAVYTEKDWEE